MNNVILHNWSSKESVFTDFENSGWGDDAKQIIPNKDDIDILLASYTYEYYSGYAFVLFRDKANGNLYEVNGSHCSCYGLEGQWSPEETTVQVLRHRLERGRLGRDYDGRNEFAEELAQVLDGLEAVDPGENDDTSRT